MGAFVQDPVLWPSGAWRWARIVLNAAGCLAALAAAVAFIRWRPSH